MNLERTDPVNWSTLKHILVSPKHYLHALAAPREDTEALLTGRVVHCMMYEPDEVGARYAVEPNFHKGMNDATAVEKGYDGGKQAAGNWAAALKQMAPEAEIVPKPIFARCVAIRDALLADPVAAPLFRGGHSEHKIEWDDPRTGIHCRGRVDHVNGAVSDLKTTRSLQWFERDAARFQYHAQLAWYYDGLRAAGIETHEAPRLIAVENVPPYDVLVLTFDLGDLAVGRRVYRDALFKLAACRESGNWPGVSQGVARRIALPAWATASDEEFELTMDGESLEV